jgi:hypothetical protein
MVYTMDWYGGSIVDAMVMEAEVGLQEGDLVETR